MLGGVTLKANDNFDGGFRIAAKDGGAYYDYSAAAVTDMLSNYLSPKVTALLKNSNCILSRPEAFRVRTKIPVSPHKNAADSIKIDGNFLFICYLPA